MIDKEDQASTDGGGDGEAAPIAGELLGTDGC